jgi:hypothetical protein
MVAVSAAEVAASARAGARRELVLVQCFDEINYLPRKRCLRYVCCIELLSDRSLHGAPTGSFLQVFLRIGD